MTKTETIRDLNDKFRRGEIAGRFLLMGELATEKPEVLSAALQGVKNYDKFKPRNDPYEEHDFGSFDLNGRTVMFKIDYYARDDMESLSPDASDQSVTTRVMTIFYAEDY